MEVICVQMYWGYVVIDKNRFTYHNECDEINIK